MGGMLNWCKFFWLFEMNREKIVYLFILMKLMYNILIVVLFIVKVKLFMFIMGRCVGLMFNKDKFFVGVF